MPQPIEQSTRGPKRAIKIALFILAVVVTTFVWSGLSLKDLLAAVGFHGK